jgi:hypothetical protein
VPPTRGVSISQKIEKLGDEAPRDKPEQEMAAARQSRDSHSRDRVPREDRGPRPEPPHGRTVIGGSAHDADIRTRSAPHGLAYHSPHDIAAAQYADYCREALHRQDFQVEFRHPGPEWERAESGNVEVSNRLQVGSGEELPRTEHPDRQPSEVQPGTRRGGRRLALQPQAGDRGLQLARDHLAEARVFAQQQDTP